MAALDADGRRQPESHGPQTATGQMLPGMPKTKMLSHPHLVLADVATDEGVVTDRLGKLTQERGRVNPVARCVVAPAEFFLPPLTLSLPVL